MNKLFDCCLCCIFFRDTKIPGKSYCIKFNITSWDSMNSCDYGELSLWAINKMIIRPERVEKGGTRESEFFE